MKVIKKILPGADGSKRLLERYGKDLVCVRYRLDADQKLRYTTVEIIVDQVRYSPITPKYRQLFPRSDQIVLLKIDFRDIELRKDLIKHGGLWDNEKNCGKLPTSRPKNWDWKTELRSSKLPYA